MRLWEVKDSRATESWMVMSMLKNKEARGDHWESKQDGRSELEQRRKREEVGADV